jgi:putative ABC transport system permease protein
MIWRRRRRADADYRSEIESHIELEIAELVAEGLSPADAAVAARRRFGNVTRAAERYYESGRLLWLDHLRQDVRSALSAAGRAPVASAVAILSLAGGIGSATTTLTVRKAVFYNPPPLYQNPDQLFRIQLATAETSRRSIPGPLYLRWSADPDLRRLIAAAGPARAVEARTADRTTTVHLQAVTADFFTILGVGPAFGRIPPAGAEVAGVDSVVLSHRVWQNEFGASADVVGSVVWMDDRPHTIAGIMPERFWFGSTEPRVWGIVPAERFQQMDGVSVVVRRPESMTAAALNDRLQRDTEEYAAAVAEGRHQMRVLISGMGGTPLADQMAVVIPPMIGMAVLLTLLIACANVAILMFARWTARDREMTVRASLGASRGRVIRLLLTESVVIAAAGGALGVCATFGLRALLYRNVPEMIDFDLSVDHAILVQTAALTVGAGLIAGFVPALHETRRLHLNPMRLVTASDRGRQRWRHALVVTEIAVTVSLLVAAGGQIDAARRMLSRDLGFRTTPLLTTRVENQAGVPVSSVVELLAGVPGVASASAGTALPLVAYGPFQRVASLADGSASVGAERALVDRGYFATLGVRIHAGRGFAQAEMTTRARVLLVDDTLADRLWPGGDALGAHAWIDKTPYEIIGIVARHSSDPLARPAPLFFLPLPDQSLPSRMDFVVRASGDPASLLQPIRRAIRALGPGYEVTSAYTFDGVIDGGAREVRVVAYAMGPLIGMGLFLTATGVFGVLAFTIARRSKELALRVAIGATRAQIVWLVSRRTLQIVAAGTALGTATAFALTRVVRAVGGGGTPFDTPGWLAFALPVATIVVVSALATCIPAVRAVRIQPAEVLRTE